MSDLKRSGEEFVREILDVTQTLGDQNCMLLEEPSATTAPRGRKKQSSSQSALFPPESRQNAVSVHWHLNRPSAQNGAPPRKYGRDLAGDAELQEEDWSSGALVAQVLCADAAEEKTHKPKIRTSSRIAAAFEAHGRPG